MRRSDNSRPNGGSRNHAGPPRPAADPIRSRAAVNAWAKIPPSVRRERGRKASEDSALRVVVHNTRTDDVWIYFSEREAARALNVPHSTMSRWLSDISKQPGLQSRPRKRYRTLTAYRFYRLADAPSELLDQ